ncbi:MAG: hypothetical protein ACE5JI_13210 [Acidobacteriota bacterium]
MPNVDSLIATLNTLEVGELGKIRAQLLDVRAELEREQFVELVEMLDACLEALAGRDLEGFRRLKATLVSQLGHLR